MRRIGQNGSGGGNLLFAVMKKKLWTPNTTKPNRDALYNYITPVHTYQYSLSLLIIAF